MMSLHSVLGNLTLAEIEQRFAGGKPRTSESDSNTPKHKFEINTKLAEVTIPIQGCQGANFFEHVVSGVTILSQEGM